MSPSFVRALLVALALRVSVVNANPIAVDSRAAALGDIQPISMPLAGKVKRDYPKHCVDSVDGPGDPGNLLCIDSDGNDLSCDECVNDFGGSGPASAKNGVECYITTKDDSSLGNRTACPGDPRPKKNPDGSDVDDAVEGIIDAFCDASGSEGVFGFATWAACYAWSYSQAPDEYQREVAGITALCDEFTFGLCTVLQDDATDTGSG